MNIHRFGARNARTSSRGGIRQKSVFALLMASAAAVTSLGVADIAYAQDTTAAVDDGTTLEGVIVTARRREEQTQDVPISITSFSAERLQEQGINSTQSLQASVPSLVVGANGQGSRETESPTIRGQGATFQASPGVAVYLAEVPLISTITLSQQGGPGNYLDLQNVQVLKGPQGTLFGRNTTGGAILLEPKRPTNDREGYVQGQVGNYDDAEFQAVVNMPIIDDKLLVRFAGEFVDRDGFTQDINWHKDRDDKHYWAGRLGVTWRPTDTIENYLMVNYANSHSNGAGVVPVSFNNAYLAIVGSCLGACTAPITDGIAAAQAARGPRVVAHSVDSMQKTKAWGVTDIFALDLSENLTLRNIANYSEIELFYRYDGDGSIAPINDTNPTGTYPRDAIRQYSEELQLQGTALDDHFNYVVGAFYYVNEPNGIQTGDAVNLGFPDGVDLPRGVGVTNRSIAGYLQGTYDFGAMAPSLENLRLTLGYRYTKDKIEGFTNTISGSDENAADTWTVGLDYDVNEDTLVYGRVSRGYKAGGFNTYAVRPDALTFGPEVVTSYEAGFKSDFHVGDAPARLNMNVFYLDYDSIQRAAGDFNFAPPPGFAQSGAQVLSVASAKMKGVELEALIRPIPSLELGANYSYIDAEYTSYNYTVPGPFPHQDCSGAFIPAGGTADLSCLPLQYLSPNIASAYARYEFPIDPKHGDLSLFVNYSWTDEQHTEALYLEQNQPGERLESFGLVNASLDWRKINGSPVDASLFVTNLTNELYRVSNNDIYPMGVLGVQATLYGEPRMYGFRLRYHWGA